MPALEPELQQQAQRFIDEWQTIRETENERRGFSPPEPFSLHYNGGAFCKIVARNDAGTPTCVEAFIAVQDGENKSIGAYQRGQIFKPHGWSMPARHARGTIWQHAGEVAGPWGINYLRP